MPHVHVRHDSRLPVAQLFARLSDHDGLGAILGAPVKRIRVGDDGANGVGSVRRVGAGPLALEETVIASEADRLIEYRITRGGFPLRNHHGTLAFSSTATGSRVEWTIRFDSALPLVGHAIAAVLKLAIGRGLRRLG